MVIAILPEIVIAVVAVLVLLAMFPLSRIIAGILQQAPFGIGVWMVERFIDITWGAYNAVYPAASEAAQVLVALFILPFHRLNWLTDSIGELFTEVGWTLWFLHFTAIPEAEQRAYAYAGQLYVVATGYALDLYHTAIAFDLALFRQAISYSGQLFLAATAYALLLYNTGIAFDLALYAQGLAYSTQLFASEIAYALQLYHTATGFATALYNSAIGYAAQVYGLSIAYTQTVTGLLQREIADGRVIDRAYAQSLYRAAVATALGSIGAVTVEVEAIRRSPCMRWCNPLGDLGSDLSELEDIFAAGALFALVAEMAHDPRGAAHEIVSTLGPVAQAAKAEFTDLTGIKAA